MMHVYQSRSFMHLSTLYILYTMHIMCTIFGVHTIETVNYIIIAWLDKIMQIMGRCYVGI